MKITLTLLSLILSLTFSCFAEEKPQDVNVAITNALIQEHAKALVKLKLSKTELEAKNLTESSEYKLCDAKIHMLEVELLQIELSAQESIESNVLMSFKPNHPEAIKTKAKTVFLRKKLEQKKAEINSPR